MSSLSLIVSKLSSSKRHNKLKHPIPAKKGEHGNLCKSLRSINDENYKEVSKDTKKGALKGTLKRNLKGTLTRTLKGTLKGI